MLIWAYITNAMLNWHGVYKCNTIVAEYVCERCISKWDMTWIMTDVNLFNKHA